MPKLEVVNANNVIEYSPQKANFKLKNTGGPKGEPGAQGPKGDTGPQGPAGPQGIQGEKGDKGAQGERGPQGIQGPQGPQGIQGPKGDKGDKGNTGATGPQGPQGPAGQNGTNGQDGTDGFSPIATVTQEGLDAEISITDKNGTTTATVPGFGVQVVESLPATGSPNIIYLERDSNSASGNPISIADAVQAPFNTLDLKGNTSQQTYVGKNLLKLGGNTTEKGLTISRDATTGALTFGGTTTGTWPWLNNSDISLPAGTYTFSIDRALPYDLYLRLYETSSSYPKSCIIQAGQTSGTATTTYSIVYLAMLYGVASSGTQVPTTTIHPMLESGSTATTPFEPYTNGPAPNPDYPQAVQTVTGENVVEIHGKNLWGAEKHGNLDENTGQEVANNNRWVTDGYIPVKSNTAYTLSSDAENLWYIFCFYDANQNFISGVSYYGHSQTQTTPANCKFVRCVVCDTATIKTTQRQLEEGSQATAYEPYQSQSYEVNLGKNLFDKDNANVLNAYFALPSDTTITSNAQNRTLYVPCNANTTYTFQAMGSNWIRQVGYTATTPAAGVSVSGITNLEKNATSVTITTGSTAKYLVFRFWHQNNSAETYQQALDSIQIEKGSTATPHAAYFEPIELCKIGTYQDYIYKSDGKWYVRKEVGKSTIATLTGHNYGINTSQTNTTRVWLQGYISQEAANIQVSDQIGVYRSNYFEFASIWSRDEEGIYLDPTTTPQQFVLRANKTTIGTNATSVETWLSSNPVDVYYVLATPTDTEITNATLVAQLEAILAGGTQAGANTITLAPSAGATGTLEVEYYDSYDSYLWVNNRWEKFAHLG